MVRYQGNRAVSSFHKSNHCSPLPPLACQLPAAGTLQSGESAVPTSMLGLVTLRWNDLVNFFFSCPNYIAIQYKPYLPPHRSILEMAFNKAPPEVILDHLSKADGSSRYSYGGYSVTATINGPIEAQRRDEHPSQAIIDVIVRPAAGVGGEYPMSRDSIIIRK